MREGCDLDPTIFEEWAMRNGSDSPSTTDYVERINEWPSLVGSHHKRAQTFAAKG